MSNYSHVSRLVEQASGHRVGWHKSLVGEGVFMHESGIHVDGLIKDRGNYQGVDPAQVGRDHVFVLGKHSGAHGVIQAYAEMGIHLDRQQAANLLLLVRRHSSLTKRPPRPNDLRRFFLEVNREQGEWSQQ